MAVAASLKDEKRNIVAIIGDGSMTGGLAYEGLNNVCSQPNNLLMILNDNNMSIDNNVGAMQDYLVKLTTSAKYNRFRKSIHPDSQITNLTCERDKQLVVLFTNSMKPPL